MFTPLVKGLLRHAMHFSGTVLGSCAAPCIQLYSPRPSLFPPLFSVCHFLSFAQSLAPSTFWDGDISSGAPLLLGASSASGSARLSPATVASWRDSLAGYMPEARDAVQALPLPHLLYVRYAFALETLRAAGGCAKACFLYLADPSLERERLGHVMVSDRQARTVCGRAYGSVDSCMCPRRARGGACSTHKLSRIR
jgi:hypothetical protein